MAAEETVNNTQNTAEETPWYANKYVVAGGAFVLGAAACYGVTKLIAGGEVIEVIADTVVDGVSALNDVAGSALI